ncbi:hypothetical protein Tco_0674272, partial [Tanacetum coccineum]
MYYKKNLDFVALIWEDLAYQIDNKDTKKQDKMFYPRFMKIIIHHFLEKDKSISMRNRTFMHTARDDNLLGTMRLASRYKDTQVYGDILPKAMTNQAMLDSVAYKTYYAIALGAEPLKLKKPKTKSDSAISSEETPFEKKPTKAKKDVPSQKKPASKPKPTKKALVKADRGKSLNVLSEVAIFEAAQLKEATKRSKKDFHISQASGSSDGTDFELGVPDEQQRKLFGTDEGISVKPGVPNVPKYDSESNKESCGDSGEEDDDEDDTEDDEGNDDGDDSDGNDDDDNDGDDDDFSDQERTESDRDTIPNLNQFNEEHEEEEENVDEFTNKVDDEENEEESDDGEELYKDVNVNLRQEDVEMTNADQGRADQHNVSQESGFEQEEEDAHKLLNFENVSPVDNEIDSLMDTTVHTKEPSGQTSTLFTLPITVIPTTIPPPPHFFNPLPQQTTPTPTPTTSKATTAVPALPDFASVFRFNDRVTNLERDLSEMKQVDHYAQSISLIPAIMDRYMDNKLGEAIHKAIKSHNAECRKEAQILPKAISKFATPVIERNVTESLEAAVLARSSSQPKSTYEAAASLS